MSVSEVSLTAKELRDLAESVLSKGASFRFKARGFSMAPFIMDGDVITVVPAKRGSIGFGQLVAFTHPLTGKLVIHRLLGGSRGVHIVKGDNILSIDGLIPERNILGIVIGICREGKRITFGLGHEKYVIGFLSQLKLLPYCWFCWMALPLSLRNLIKWAIHW